MDRHVEGKKDVLRPIDRKILSNYFWSFHHSQGNPTAQSLITIHIARQYNPEQIGPLEQLEARLKPTVDNYDLPREHTKERVNQVTEEVFPLDKTAAQEDPENGFQAQWWRLTTVFNRVFYDKPDPRTMLWFGGYEGNIYESNKLSDEKLLYQITSHIIDADIKYQTTPRPNRDPSSDPHASHLQMYIYGKNPLHSSEYVKLYQGIHDLIHKYQILDETTTQQAKSGELDETEVKTLRNKFHELKQKWQIQHSNQAFSPISTD